MVEKYQKQYVNSTTSRIILLNMSLLTIHLLVKLKKAIGPDCISIKLLKSLSYLLAAPICAIINSSFHQDVITHQWKISKIAPLPKCFSVKTVDNDVRPIVMTNSIAKIAESLLGQFFNE